ncbi:sulfatase-like hydrolase/transferase [Achromobacter sp. Marseille-Q0513]|uniref:LTA synthase family protein n=1 Tax=Achromobacter sp. Marseille-Q0513 TaxID=2829161 RepID=UPI001B95ABCF|nr:alkaline phosphatase family protein [Achromobacter sp. Marseille-Q0513]MBR8652985.1 sulfatase-like hydrolase/transferase [Achromobacter sp. Marseille-Q0513]
MKLSRPFFSWQGWFQNFQQSFLLLLAPWLVSVLAQFAGRAYLLAKHAPPSLYTASSADVGRSLTIGLLFDIKVAAIAFSAPLLAGLAIAAFPRLQRGWLRWQSALGAVMAMLFTATTVISVFYYATFARSIDVFVFGLIDEDTSAVLGTVWQGYPVLRAGLLLSAVLAATWWLTAKWRARLERARPTPRSAIACALRLLLIIGITVLACRGSISKFPLNKDDTNLSAVALLNDIAPNGISAFTWALADRDNDKRFSPVTQREGQLLYQRFLDRPGDGLEPFMAVTASNPAARERPPHVVLQVMESMGHHLSSLDAPGRDLLGALRPHWESDWRFDRFVSEGNGTIDSLARLLVRSPMKAIGQSSAASARFAGNAFAPYLQRGYRVLFVTSGTSTWRNLGSFVRQQGAHEFIDQQTLRQRYPEAQIGTWGVPDEYMFRYMEERLAEADRAGQPLFIMALSTTHHPPFTPPPGAGGRGLALDEATRAKHFYDWTAIDDVLGTLRYANDQLGGFITRVKASSAGARTIIAATGDHNILGVDYQDPNDAALAHAVPFYVYAPPAYRANAVYDRERIGSHKDIMPTLYQLSLSQAPYFQSGCDLLSRHPNSGWCFGFNAPYLMLTQAGAYQPQRPSRIRPWAGPSGLALSAERDATAEEWAEHVRLNAYPALMEWQINLQVQEQGHLRK